jgi:hypothetical protein
LNAEYCREIETYLCQKNEGHLIRVVGPAFDVVSRWEQDGIPLKVAYRGIDRYFERYYRQGPAGGRSESNSAKRTSSTASMSGVGRSVSPERPRLQPRSLAKTEPWSRPRAVVRRCASISSARCSG